MGAQEATYCQGRQEPSYRADDDFLAVPVTRRCRRCRDRVKRVKTAWLGNAVAMMLAGLEPLMSALGHKWKWCHSQSGHSSERFARPVCATSGHSSQGMLAERSLVFTFPRHLLLPHILREKLPDSIQYLAVASIDNPLPRSNRYLPELCRKLKTELTTNYNIPF
jgi:hypothetical protein